MIACVMFSREVQGTARSVCMAVLVASKLGVGIGSFIVWWAIVVVGGVGFEVCGVRRRSWVGTRIVRGQWSES